jgi:hypothetical protein
VSKQFSESLDKLLPALIKARAEFPAVKKDGYNPHFKSRFATLKAVQEATEPVMGKYGLVITQFASSVDGKPGLTTWLAHESGQYINDTTVLALAKSDPQAQGSGITYLRRYGWSSVLGLVTDEDDDDGNKATLPDASNAAKAKAEFQRLIDAAKRAGVSKDDAQSNFFKKYGKPLTANADLIGYIGEYADKLTEQAAAKELSQ